MTVSIAVTNRLSIWMPANVPRIAKAPTTTRTSCTQRDEGRDAHLEVAEPVRDPEQDADRPEEDQGQGLRDEVARHDRADGGQRLLLRDGPERFLEGEPDLAELAGGRQVGAGDRGRGRRRARPRPRERRMVPQTPRGRARRTRRQMRTGAADGAVVGTAVGAGAGAASAASFVRISMKPSPVRRTVASKPWSSTTSWTCSGVTFASSKRIGPDGAAREVDGELQADLAAR